MVSSEEARAGLIEMAGATREANMGVDTGFGGRKRTVPIRVCKCHVRVD